MKTETTIKTKKPYAIKQESIKKVCNALVEISYFNEQETVESKWLRAICDENKVPMLFNAMLSLGYIKKIKHSIYQVVYTREIVNEKLAIKMYKQYNKVKKCVREISETKKSVEQHTSPSTPKFLKREISETKKSVEQPKSISLADCKPVSIFDIWKDEKPKEIEPENSLFALIREEDVLSAPMYSSLEELMQNPPKGYGRYVVVTVGRKLEIKPQIILD
jgi:hypothetical protein